MHRECYVSSISGGAVGLFTGVSIIGIIEMAYWLTKAAKRVMANIF